MIDELSAIIDEKTEINEMINEEHKEMEADLKNLFETINS